MCKSGVNEIGQGSFDDEKDREHNVSDFDSNITQIRDTREFNGWDVIIRCYMKIYKIGALIYLDPASMPAYFAPILACFLG